MNATLLLLRNDLSHIPSNLPPKTRVELLNDLVGRWLADLHD